jgi:LysR family transcriptional regulator for metE and metH
MFSDEIVLVLAASHPLAAKKTLTADDLREATLLSPNVPPAAAKAFLGHVFGPRPPAGLRFQFLPLTEAILDLARAGMGVAVMSDWIAGPHLGRGELVTRRLATGPMRRPWRIAWRPEARDAAERLRGVVGTFTPRRTDGTTRPAAASSATTAARRPARSPR